MQVLTDNDPNKKPENYNPIELQKLARYTVDSFVDPNYRGWFVHCPRLPGFLNKQSHQPQKVRGLAQ